MSDKQAIYLVKNGDTERLVRAKNQAQVRAHLVKPVVISYAEQDDLLRLGGAGVKVEQASNGSDE